MTEVRSMPPDAVRDAFAHCEAITRGHYENFPVGSALIPRAVRPYFHAIYAYSRGADDIADEGTLTAGERIARLDEWERMLEAAYRGEADHPVFIALAATVRDRAVPIEPLRDLLTAFRLDSLNEGYETLDDLLRYCRCSANPVGRLVLALFGLLNEERAELSDRICTALQLANFWQDPSVDLPRGRVNFPREVLRRYGVTHEELESGVESVRFRSMTAALVDVAWEEFREGRRLLRMIPHRRLRWELRFVVAGGERVLRKIQALNYNVLGARPSLGVRDVLGVFARAVSI